MDLGVDATTAQALPFLFAHSRSVTVIQIKQQIHDMHILRAMSYLRSIEMREGILKPP
jgi:hypothetical protein